MPRFRFRIGPARWFRAEGEQVPQNLRIDAELFLENGDALFDRGGDRNARQPQRFRKLHQHRGDVPQDKTIVSFVPAPCDKGINHSKPQIPHRLFAKEFFKIRIELKIGQWICSMQHTVIPLDAGELRRESADTAREPALSENEGIDLRLIANGARNLLVGLGGRIVQENQKVQIRNAFDEISPDRASIQAAGQEVLPELGSQRTNRVIEYLLNFGGHDSSQS